MKKYTITEIISVAVLICFVVTLFVTQSGGTKKSIAQVTPEPLKVLDTNNMSKKSKADISNTFSLNADEIEEYCFYSCDDVMNVKQILIIKFKDKNSVKTSEKAVTKALDERKNLFKNYAPDQYALLQKSIVKSSGNMLFYCTATNCESVYSAYKKAL